MTLNGLLEIPYLANGRDRSGVDCYGGVRFARYHLFGRGLMPDYTTVDGSDKRAMTEAMLSESAGYHVVSRRAGAIATAWRGRLCIHIAICVIIDRRLMILEWDNDAPLPRLVHPSLFERQYSRVVYYDN